MKKRENVRERRLILAVTAPLSGLIYIVLLPLVGIFTVILVILEKVARELPIKRHTYLKRHTYS